MEIWKAVTFNHQEYQVLTKVCSKCAIEKPLIEFYKHKQCAGGVAPSCKLCRISQIKTYSASPEGRATRALHKKNNLETYRQRDNQRYYRNRTKRLEAVKSYYPKIKECKALYNKKYINENRAAINTYQSNRNSYKLKSQVGWSEVDSIKEFYKNCPEGYAVDHIIPLMGKIATGLHVLCNLQYLPISINNKKRHRVLDNYNTPYPACDISIYKEGLPRYV